MGAGEKARPLRPLVRARCLWRRVRRAARRVRAATRRSRRRSARSRTSSIAAPRAPTPRPATARASSSSFRTRSCAPWPASSCRQPGRYGVAVCFLPTEAARRRELEELLERTVAAEGQVVLGWRDIPVDQSAAGAHAEPVRPGHAAALRRRRRRASTGDLLAFERKLYVIRRVAERAAGPDLVIPSFSARTLVYKGMLMAPQLAPLLPRPRRRADDRARSRSSTRASRPTRSRAGSSRIRTG